MRLVVSQFTPTGILGELYTDDFKLIGRTLEHAYKLPDKEEYLPKLSPGNYRCFKRHSNRFNMDVYEIEEVPFNLRITPKKLLDTYPLYHKDILFHPGNFNKDSEGCVLLGEEAVLTNEGWMVTNSKKTFEKFMKECGGADFILRVGHLK